MANRIELQTALDAIKCANCMNDLIDCLSWQVQEIDPNNGSEFKVTEPTNGIEKEAVRRIPTFAELRTIVAKTVPFINGYWIKLDKCFKRADVTELENGLAALGMDITNFKAEVASMKAVADHIQSLQLSAKNKANLKSIGEMIDADVPKLKLIRRDWVI